MHNYSKVFIFFFSPKNLVRASPEISDLVNIFPVSFPVAISKELCPTTKSPIRWALLTTLGK